MAATALLKFRDGLNTGVNGQAFLSQFGQNVIIENSVNTDVASWQIWLVYAPPGTAREIRAGIDPYTLLAQSPNTGTPFAILTNLEYGFPGCYRIMLEVFNGTNYSGVKDTDIRNIGILTSLKQFVIPPYQLVPAQLPVTGSGVSGAKPNELNFGGQAYGWSGGLNPDAKGMNDALLFLEGSKMLPPFTTADADRLTTVALSFDHYLDWVVTDGVDFWCLSTDIGSGIYPKGYLRGNAQGTTIQEFKTFDETLNSYRAIVYEPTQDQMVILAEEQAVLYPVSRTHPAVKGAGTTISSSYGRGLITGGGYLWVQSDAALYRVNPADFSSATLVANGDSLHGYMDFDESPQYGDAYGRLFTANQYTYTYVQMYGVRRYHPVTLALEGVFVPPGTSDPYNLSDVAIDSANGRFWISWDYNGERWIGSFDTGADGGTFGANPRVASMSAYVATTSASSLAFDPVTQRAIFLWRDLTFTYSQVVVAYDNGVTLDLTGVTMTDLSTPYVIGSRAPKIHTFGGYAWFVCTTGSTWHIVRFNMTTGTHVNFSSVADAVWQDPSGRVRLNNSDSLAYLGDRLIGSDSQSYLNVSYSGGVPYLRVEGKAHHNASFMYTGHYLTTGTNPGEGYVKFDNAVTYSATHIYISNSERDESLAGTTRFAGYAIGTLRTGDRIAFQQCTSNFGWGRKLFLFRVTGAITNSGAYSTIPVTCETYSTNFSSPFGYGEKITVTFIKAASENVVKVSAVDTTPNYLINKLGYGNGLGLSVVDLGGGNLGLSYKAIYDVRNLTLSAGTNILVGDGVAYWTSAPAWRFDSPAAAEVTGLYPCLNYDDCLLRKIYNVGTYDITFKHQSVSSTVDARIIIPGGVDLVMAPDDVVDITYDRTNSRWRIG